MGGGNKKLTYRETQRNKKSLVAYLITTNFAPEFKKSIINLKKRLL